MTLSDLAAIARIAREARTGKQIDPEVYGAAFVDGFAAFLLREEQRHRDDCHQINDDLVDLVEMHPSTTSILSAVAQSGGRIEVR